MSDQNGSAAPPVQERARDASGRFAPAAAPGEPGKFGSIQVNAPPPGSTLNRGFSPEHEQALAGLLGLSQAPGDPRAALMAGQPPPARVAPRAPQSVPKEVRSMVGDEPAAAPPQPPPEAKPAAPEKNTPESSGGTTEAAQETGAYEAALKALRLDGWSKDDFDGLPPSRIVALGEKAKARQARLAQELDTRTSRIAELERRIPAAARKGEAALDGADDIGNGEGEPEAFYGAVKRFADEHGLGDEAGEDLAELFDAVRSESDDMRRTASAMASALEHLITRDAKSSLGKHLPDVDKHWDAIYAKAKTLAKTGDYESLDEAVDDAADIVTGGALRLARMQQQEELRRKRDNGQPDVPTSAPAQTRANAREPATLAEARDMALWILVQAETNGSDPDVARAEAKSLVDRFHRR